jgi:hypothetical protein
MLPDFGKDGPGLANNIICNKCREKDPTGGLPQSHREEHCGGGGRKSASRKAGLGGKEERIQGESRARGKGETGSKAMAVRAGHFNEGNGERMHFHSLRRR